MKGLGRFSRSALTPKQVNRLRDQGIKIFKDSQRHQKVSKHVKYAERVPATVSGVRLGIRTIFEGLDT